MARMLFTVLALATLLVAGAHGGAARAQTTATADYRLDAGDRLRVITFGEQALTGEFQVADTGQVALPLIGEVRAKGLTLAEFKTSVEEALREGYLKDPRVSVEVINYRPYYILGEVTKPGEYPYTSGLTVLKAVATAEGFTYRANTKKVFIKRADGSREEELSLTSTTIVQPGDTIRIAERFF